jgi:2-oxoglutarate ferredoxin oxidoreductase subunit beta
MSSEELAGKIVVGEFVNKDIPEYTEQYLSLIERVRGKDHE